MICKDLSKEPDTEPVAMENKDETPENTSMGMGNILVERNFYSGFCIHVLQKVVNLKGRSSKIV